MEDRKVKGNEGEQGELEEQMERCSFGEVSDCLVVEVVEELVGGGGAEGEGGAGGEGGGGDEGVKLLKEWGVRSQVASLVFDTTSSNSSAEVGACRWLEDHISEAVLWAACRHHILELHVNRVVAAITGHTKDPGVKLFRRLKMEWSTFSTSGLPRWMEEEAAEVLAWGQGHLLEGTFARGDYREFLQLVVVTLGGEREEGFTFKIPGADHHARWMSKGIKMFLLSHQFRLSEEEQEQVSRIVIFVIVIYARA